MTERDLSQAVHLKAELEALRRVAAEDPSADVLTAVDAQARAVEAARLEVMSFIATVPDPRIRAIAVMRFLEGKSWETIARRMHYERSSPAKQLRKFLRGRMQPCPSSGFLSLAARKCRACGLHPYTGEKKFYILACNSRGRTKRLVMKNT